MPVNDELGKRMKEYYEQIPKTKLMRRTPVAIRLDGKAFHTFTKGFQKPFDKVLVKSMQETTKYLCENIQGCVLGYTQSDEITLILVDYKNLNTAAWFDYEVQKMCSIAASMATLEFNRQFEKFFEDYIYSTMRQNTHETETEQNYIAALNRAAIKGAMFDARVFNIPKEEVTNLIYWRQLDAMRNSVQMVGQANFSHSELQNKSCIRIKNILSIEKGISWDTDIPIHLQRGSCCVKESKTCISTEISEYGEVLEGRGPYLRTEWIIDKEIPIFKDEGREYIERLVNV